MSTTPLLGSVGLVLWLAVSSQALAQTQPPVRLTDLFETLSEAPQSRAAEAQVAQGRALIDQADRPPNPRLSLSVENFTGSGPYRHFGRAESTLALEQTLELGQKRQNRVALARANQSQTEAEAAKARADLVLEITTLYLDLLRVQEQKTLLAEGLELAKQDEATTRALVVAGRETQLKLDLAELATLKLAADQNRLIAEHTATLAKLKALTQKDLTSRSLARDLLARHDLKHQGKAYPGQSDHAAANPDLKTASAKVAQARATVQLEKARAVPDLTTSLGIRRLEGERANVLMAQVSIPLPLFDQNTGQRRAAEATHRAAEFDRQALESALLAEQAGLTAQLLAAEAEIRTVFDQEARLAKAYQTSKRAYEAGKLTLLELTAARRDWLDARTQALNAQISALKAESQLARLAGQTPFQDH